MDSQRRANLRWPCGCRAAGAALGIRAQRLPAPRLAVQLRQRQLAAANIPHSESRALSAERQGLGAGSAERVGDDVGLAGDVLRDDGEVVLGGQLVQGAQGGEHGRAAGRLAVDDGHVALVVDAQLDDRVTKGRAVGGDRVQRGQRLEQTDVMVREEALVADRKAKYASARQTEEDTLLPLPQRQLASCGCLTRPTACLS